MKPECKISKCGRESVSRGFCGRHYAQFNRGLITESGEVVRPPTRTPLRFQEAQCQVQNCLDKVKTLGWCNKHYLRFRAGTMTKTGEPTGKQRYWHNKGYRTYQRGYRKIRAPEGHPGADKDGYVLEHRLVMERLLGRFLTRAEVVHHKNGVRDDNRPENLELCESRKKHKHGHEIDSRTAVQVLLQQDSLPSHLREELVRFSETSV